MSNVLELNIVKNEIYYDQSKQRLEKIIDEGNKKYNEKLNEYRKKQSYIDSDNYLNDSGKKAKSIAESKKYERDACDEAQKVNEKLLKEADGIINSIGLKNEEKNKPIQKNILTPLTYVSSMIGLISNLEDVNMLKEVYDYVCINDNFNEECINLVYMKAKSIINITGEGKSQIDAINSGKLRTTLQGMISNIEKYKHDYSKDFEEFKNRFSIWKINKKHPKNLYMTSDIKVDFSSKYNDPWGR